MHVWFDRWKGAAIITTDDDGDVEEGKPWPVAVLVDDTEESEGPATGRRGHDGQRANQSAGGHEYCVCQVALGTRW
jgi:hypothetical protein